MWCHELLRTILSRREHLGNANVVGGASIVLGLCLELELIVVVLLVLVRGFDLHLVVRFVRW